METPFKRCAKCGIEKPMNLFYSDKSKKNGLSSYCALCLSIAKRNRVRNLEPDDRRKARKNYNAANQEKHSAWKKVERAMLSGRIIKMPCEKCGSKDAHAHHDDYSLPLDVRWFCGVHHRQHHVLVAYANGAVYY